MNNVYVLMEDIGHTVLEIGYVAENLRTSVCIDCSKTFSEYPNSIPSMSIFSPAGVKYPGNIRRDGNNVWWEVTDSDLAKEGNGELQLTFIEDVIVAKSDIGTFHANRSLVATEPAPDPIADWVTRADAELDSIPQKVANAVDEVVDEFTTSAHDLPHEDDPTVTFNPETKEFSFGIPEGPKGDPGDPGNPGEPGFSPTVQISEITGGHRIVIIDESGPHTADVMDGEKGDPGNPGSPGYSPTVSVTAITGGHRITITDRSGPHSCDVMDGDPATIIDDTAGSGVTNKVWSANKSSELLSAINTLRPAATSSDIGKALLVKTVSNGKPTSYEYGEAGGGVSIDLKTALLSLAENVAYANNQGQTVYNALAAALYDTAWPVTNTLSHCTTSNNAQSVTKNASYSATITADTDYTLTGATVVITMGGVDITSTAYSNGTISIASVTGILSISITAEAETPTVGYVTDGLVAYWDGIDNTGNGHDGTATTWADLIGSYDLTQGTVGGTWDTNALVFNRTNNNCYYRNSLWTYSENCTIEVVLAPNNNYTMGVATFERDDTSVSSGMYDARRFIIYSDDTIGFVGKSGFTYTDPTGGITSIRKLVAVYSGFTVSKAFANNTQLSLSNKTHSYRWSGDQQMVIGDLTPSSATAAYTGKIYAIRVYNRQLTDAEITQNFEYDNTRFSLGVT